MPQETPKKKFEIPDTCSCIVLIIESCAPQRFFDYILRVNFLDFFMGDVTVDILRAKGEDHNDRKIEIKRNPKIPLKHAEREFLENISNMEGVEILFY